MVRFDQPQIKQVMEHMLINAAKFSPEGASIQVSLTHGEHTMGGGKPASGLCCHIQDEGPGVPEAELTTVFEKFYQSTRTKTNAGGTGLGLSICTEIIQMHHGAVWVENIADGGCRFSFLLPDAQASGLTIDNPPQCADS